MYIESEIVKDAIGLLIKDAEAKAEKPEHKKFYAHRAACFKEVLNIIEQAENIPEEEDNAGALECVNCGYFWREEDDDYPHCHWESRCPGDVAPCDEPEEVAEDYGVEDYDFEEEKEFDDKELYLADSVEPRVIKL